MFDFTRTNELLRRKLIVFLALSLLEQKISEKFPFTLFFGFVASDFDFLAFQNFKSFPNSKRKLFCNRKLDFYFSQENWMKILCFLSFKVEPKNQTSFALYFYYFHPAFLPWRPRTTIERISLHFILIPLFRYIQKIRNKINNMKSFYLSAIPRPKRDENFNFYGSSIWLNKKLFPPSTKLRKFPKKQEKKGYTREYCKNFWDWRRKFYQWKRHEKGKNAVKLDILPPNKQLTVNLPKKQMKPCQVSWIESIDSGVKRFLVKNNFHEK